jgi:succinoglycan biosynthesis protein ExoA
MDDKSPTVSIILPVRNEERSIARVLGQLLEQNYPAFQLEIVVVDGGSTDRTEAIVAEIASQHSQVRLLHNPQRWSSAARNIGLRASVGELVVIVDGHCDLNNPGYVRSLVEIFERSGADCLGRPQPLQASRPNRIQQAISAARSSRLGHHPQSFVYFDREQVVPAKSVAVAYRRTVFETVGLFDERFDACEDVELNHRIDRAGLKCVLAPQLRVFYEPRSSLPRLFKQLMRYGQGRVRLLRKHPETFSLLGFAPAALLMVSVFGALGIAVSRWLAFLYVMCVTSYLTLIAAASVQIATKLRQWVLLPCLPAVFLTLHLGAGAGILLELLSGDSRRVEIGRTR